MYKIFMENIDVKKIAKLYIGNNVKELISK